MAWRKCLVRTLVFSIVGGLSAAGYLYQRWTSPAIIREQLVERLQELLPGANITLNSARLSLLGHIVVEELRLSRRDDPDKDDFAHFQSAKIYHDKEQLLDGKLVIRKIELQKPRVRLVRGPNGRWNISGDLFSKPRPELSIPTVVIKDGTVSIEDHFASPSHPAIEIKNIYSVLVNDPLAEVKFDFHGKSELVGDLNIAKGTWWRNSGALAIRLEAPTIPIKAPLIHTLAAYLPKLAEHARQLEGTAKVWSEVGYEPASAQAWSHKVTCQLRDGKLAHPLIPLPLHQVEASVHCRDGELVLEKLKGLLGSSNVELTGRARLDDAVAVPDSRVATLEALTPSSGAWAPERANFSGDLRIEGLSLTREIFGRLPEKIQDLDHKYSPRGPINLTLHFSRNGGDWVRKTHVEAVDVSATFHRFLYTLKHIHGNFDEDIDTRRQLSRLRVALEGKAGERDVRIVGGIEGEGKDSAVEIDIWGENIVMDESLKNALRVPPETDQPGPHEEPKLYKLACEFHPSGQLDFRAFIRRDANARVFKNRYQLRFHHATMCYDVFPYPLDNVSGILDVLPDSWEARDFVGSHHGGVIRVRARSDPLPHALGRRSDLKVAFVPWLQRGDTKNRLWVEITGEHAALDRDLDAALAARPQNAELAETWKLFHPRGTIDFFAVVDQWDRQPPEIDVTAWARGCAIRPDFFPYDLTDLSGKFRYAQRQVIGDEIRARHGATAFSLDRAHAYLKDAGGVHVQLLHFRGKQVMLNRELLAALPPGIHKICSALQVQDPFDLALARFVVDTNAAKDGSPYLYWDGGVTLDRARFYAGVAVENVSGTAACRGQFSERHLQALTGTFDFRTASILNQPFQDLHGNFDIPGNTTDVLDFKGLSGRIFGGEVYGTAQIEFGPNTHYELNVSAANIRLEDFARANLGGNAPLNGIAVAKLYLHGQGADIQSLTGKGSIDVPSGRLYNLPTFLGLLKILDLRAPNNVFFDEAHARYTIQGSKVTVNQLDLFGNPFSLRGQGDMTLYGTDIRLDFYAVGMRVLDYLPPVIKEFPRMLSENLWKIKVRGKIGDIKVIQEPVPVVVTPARDLLKNLSERRKQWPGIRNQESGVRGQRSEVRDQESGVGNRHGPPLLPDP